MYTEIDRIRRVEKLSIDIEHWERLARRAEEVGDESWRWEYFRRAAECRIERNKLNR